MVNNISLKENLKMSQLQQTVDDLKNLLYYAEKYNADNKNMIKNDLKRAEEKLETTLKEGK